MTSQFIGEIRVLAFGSVPRGWALCNGKTILIRDAQALFGLLGTVYGGDGVQTFGLPDLCGRVPLHVGPGYPPGQRGGQESVTLATQEMPRHTHSVNVVNANAYMGPSGGQFAAANGAYQAPPANTSLPPQTIDTAGGGLPHENRQPFLTVNFVIALQGIFPPRN